MGECYVWRGNKSAASEEVKRVGYTTGKRGKGGRITSRRKDGPKAGKTRRTRVGQKYSLNVKEVRLIKPTDKCRRGINVRRSSAFSAPQSLCVCRSAGWECGIDRFRRDLDFHLIIETPNDTMQHLHFNRSALLTIKCIFQES